MHIAPAMWTLYASSARQLPAKPATQYSLPISWEMPKSFRPTAGRFTGACTGKDLGEYGDVPYHLIDIVPAGAKFNIYQYQSAFAEAWADIRSRGAIPILCGGSGLYIESVTRAYKFQKENGLDENMLPRKVFYIGTLVSREERVARIDKRLEERLKEGLVDEIRGLLQTVPADDLIYYGLEYKFVTQYILGHLSYDDMVIALGNAIHQFAKRQMTWFRGMERDGVRIHWVRP